MERFNECSATQHINYLSFSITDLSARRLCQQFGQRKVPKSPTESNKRPYLDKNLISDAVWMLLLQGQAWVTCALVFRNRVRLSRAVELPKSFQGTEKFSLHHLTLCISFMPSMWNHTLFRVGAIYICWRERNVNKEQVLSGLLIQEKLQDF